VKTTPRTEEAAHVVIRVEGASPKPRRVWLRIWAALMAMGLIVGVAVSLNNANAPRELPPCNEVDDPDAVRCDHFWLRPPSDSR
jgi:hypothetical protein